MQAGTPIKVDERRPGGREIGVPTAAGGIASGSTRGEMTETKGRVVPAIGEAYALAVMRLTMGALFVWVFFENMGKHLYSPGPYAGLIRDYIKRSAAPAIWKQVMELAAANAAIAGPMQGATEIAFGVLLVLGLLTRPVAFMAFGFLTSLWVSELGTAWIWELLVPMMVCLAIALAPSGGPFALDRWLKRRFPRYPFA